MVTAGDPTGLLEMHYGGNQFPSGGVVGSDHRWEAVDYPEFLEYLYGL